MACVALVLPDPGGFGGPIFPTSTGFNWRLFAVVHDTVSGRKESLQGFSADTLDGDSLVQVRDKIIAATQAKASEFGFTVTAVVLTQMAVVTGL